MLARQVALPDTPVPCVVETKFRFPTDRRRDPHNFVAPQVKAMIDELVLAGWWPDDNPLWVTVAEPVLLVGRGLPPRWVLRAWPRRPAVPPAV